MSVSISGELAKEQAPGTILAKNKETGILYRIRPNMLKIGDHPWEVLPEGPAKIDEPAVESTDSGSPAIIMTADHKPFKTETAARTAMTRKKLSDTEYFVIPQDTGYVIKRV